MNNAILCSLTYACMDTTCMYVYCVHVCDRDLPMILGLHAACLQELFVAILLRGSKILVRQPGMLGIHAIDGLHQRSALLACGFWLVLIHMQRTTNPHHSSNPGPLAPEATMYENHMCIYVYMYIHVCISVHVYYK